MTVIKEMKNLRMREKLERGQAIDVEQFGAELEPGVFLMPMNWDPEGFELCVASREAWIMSVGRRKSDKKVYAATDNRFYQDEAYTCLWLR